MDRNRLAKLLIISALLNFSACGGAVESPGSDSKTSPTPAAASSAAPTPHGGTNAAAPAAATTPPPSSGETAARQAASPASDSRGASGAPPAKMPTPRIGTGGNDFFLFTQARAAVSNDPELRAANLVIEVKEGVVTLNGTVASASLKLKAEQLARDAGSKAVRNQLRVSGGR